MTIPLHLAQPRSAGDQPGSRPEAVDLLAAFWHAIDLFDADRVASLFAPDGTLWWGDEPPVHGRSAIRRAFVYLFSEVISLRHEPVALWSLQSLIVADADLHVRRGDDVVVNGASTTVLRTAAQQIEECRVTLSSDPGLPRVVHRPAPGPRSIAASAGILG